jgi:hypothetical protein
VLLLYYTVYQLTYPGITVHKMIAKSVINSTPEMEAEGFSKTSLNFNQAITVSHLRKGFAVITQFKPRILILTL